MSADTEHWHRVVESPIGPLSLGTDGHALRMLHLGDPDGTPTLPLPGTPAQRLLDLAERELDAYFDGTLRTFTVPLRCDGTTFQRSVWEALYEIPYGETASYGDIARRIGQPGASRAVGLANNRNPIAIIVPCHRVIGASGSLTGYGGGVDRKRHLLDLERSSLGATLW